MRPGSIFLAVLAAAAWSLLAGCAPARHYEAALVRHDLLLAERAP